MKGFAILIAFLVLSLPAHSAREVVGKIITLNGTAKAVDPEKAERKLALREDIFLNDRILTGAGSRIQIMMRDDTVITQAENGDMLIDEYAFDPDVASKNKSKFKISRGLFRVITGKITDLNPKAFEVRNQPGHHRNPGLLRPVRHR